METEIGIGDDELLERARAGEDAAFEELFRRHAPLARRVAAGVTRHHADQDDAVAAAFADVWSAVRNGRGPKESFAPYLVVAVRRAAMNISARAAKSTTYDPDENLQGKEDMYSVLDSVDSILALRALNSLPSRWQTVLWYVLVEGQSARRTAEILGSNANAVAAMTMRAKEGLRQAFAEVNTNTHAASTCGVDVRQLMRYSRGLASHKTSAYLDAHIPTCTFCQQREMEIAGVAGTLQGRVRSAAYGVPVLTALAKHNSLLKLRLLPISARTGIAALVAAGVATTVVLWPQDSPDSAPRPEPGASASLAPPPPTAAAPPAQAPEASTSPESVPAPAEGTTPTALATISQPSWPLLAPGTAGTIELIVSATSEPLTLGISLPTHVRAVAQELPPGCTASSQTVLNCSIAARTTSGTLHEPERISLPVMLDSTIESGTVIEDGRAWLSTSDGAIRTASEVPIRVEAAGGFCPV